MPGGEVATLLSVPVYDFNWQHTYVFSKPVRVPAGASLKTVAHWDNSALNPNNPNPASEVVWGQQSNQEMQTVAVTYVVDE